MRNAISKLFGRKAAAAPAAIGTAQVAAPRAARAVPPAVADLDNPLTIDDNSDNATRRQLVQMMLRDGLRKHGIPLGWIECRMLVVNSRSRGSGLYVRLVMRHWDMLLLTYAHAFQQQLREAITQFEPKASEWLHGISWELDVGDTCPYQDMPDPSIWTETSTSPVRPVNTTTAAAAAATPVATTPVFAVPRVAAVAAAALPSATFVLDDPVPAVTPMAGDAAPAPDDEAEVMRDLERMFAIRDAHLGEQSFADTAPVAMDFQNTEPASRA